MLFFASWFPHPEEQYFPKNQLSPATHLHSSWKIWVKHSATHTHTHTHTKQGTKWCRTFITTILPFLLFIPKVFKSPSSNDPVPWDCRTIFMNTCRKGGSPGFNKWVPGCRGMLNDFKRLEVRETKVIWKEDAGIISF